MKIKNLLMQLFVITPLTVIMGICTFCLVFPFLPMGDSAWDDMNFGALIFTLILMFAISVGISKILLRIKGKEIETTYWDSDFEYEIRNDYGDHYSLHQTKGGWTTNTKFYVFIYALMAPILLVTRLFAIIFAFASLGKRSRIFSYYGGIDYHAAELKCIPLQRVLHFLFDIVIL